MSCCEIIVKTGNKKNGQHKTNTDLNETKLMTVEMSSNGRIRELKVVNCEPTKDRSHELDKANS